MTPGGTPACSKISTSLTPDRGVSEEGFMTTVLPATNAAAAGAPSSAYGKFQGAMTAHTPYGRSTLVFVSVGTSRPISRT
jgi:hypothetical protein